MAEIHRLTGAGPVFEPLPDVIELAEKIVAMARSGDLKGVAIAWVDSQDTVSTEWAAGCARRNDMLAAVTRLSFRVAGAFADG